MRRRQHHRRALLALAGIAPLARPARAQAWPARPIRLICPASPGGAADLLSRLVAEPMARSLGVAMVIENRPGAATNLGMAALAAAPADGHTIGLASVASHAVNRWLYRTLPFDPARDFAPIGLLAVVPNLMVVPAALPVRSVTEFVAFVRANSGAVNYGSIGSGSSQHLAGAQFALAAGIGMTHVPYANAAQLNADLIAGRVQVMFASVSSVAELARVGQMRPLAATGTERLPPFPEVPTLREAGVDITSAGWFGLAAPAGVPEPVLERLNAELNAALRDPAVAARIVAVGSVPRPGTGAEFAAFMAEETERWRPVVQGTGATAD
jgi:tripartite-type tricarboxylate transporter receptor subunit TctC